MLKIKIPKAEYFNSETNEFINVKEVELQLEHSLISISKWEAKWHKPFLSEDEKSIEETIDYIKCMVVNPTNVDPMVFNNLSPEIINKILEYKDDPMTATWFSERDKGSFNREIITSDLIYYWMIALNIPSEYQKWHINRLLTLIKICNIKNSSPKKHSKDEIRRRNAELNARRRAALNTKG